MPRVSQKLRKAQQQFWAETLPTKVWQWQQKQKGRKAQGELGGRSWVFWAGGQPEGWSRPNKAASFTPAKRL